ncbi:PD-(D/E)XK nuclease-like domain-containing protein [Aurantimonas coralicida]|uniref:PD-(D/E)XK nuclease-like domain-containing protein n=1 Tax=Aurantimonas coralicida TaxID=182270 RepID=UPI001E30B4EF|nr:PD-(D/E)XK nuclease-like domain-containing protein [Aurantimonas coralicida]MCD1645297.1 PD-(D/E)XK nuclease-like domain-containing protein [Aurantimonas coralicida]
MSAEREYQGGKITQPGIYRGISLAEYHENPDLFDGPSISKSSLKWLLPSHGGSPKAFWGRWKHNPEHIAQKPTDALNFGKATHALLLGDEDFESAYAVHPAEYPNEKPRKGEGPTKPWNWNADFCKDWRDAQGAKTIISPDQRAMIGRIRDDAARYPLIRHSGILNGAVERTIAWKDPETGIWLKVRPDVIPDGDGVYADLKTAGKFDEDFLEKQAFEACYYLQGAMIRRVCRALGLPFTTFAMIYVLKDEVPDTAHVELSEHELDRGEREIGWALKTIRKCLDAGEWPGAQPFKGGERHLQLKPWVKQKIDDFLEMENAA